MENNRRSFFKGLAAFASGVVAAKAYSYIPKKEEPKETIFVPSVLTITHEGKEFHPLVVEKTEMDKMVFRSSGTTNIGNSLSIQQAEPTLRKANV
jgi:hypothetical protein